MKSFVFRATVLLGTLVMASVGCEVPVDDEAIEEEVAGEQDVQTGDQAIEATPVPICGDLVVQEMKIVFCGPQEGPYDTSPVQVTCTRTCVTDRQVKLTAPPGSGFTCVAVSKTCDAWDCPPC